MKIKVCGLRDAINILSVVGLQPDYMGFIFYGQSPRYAGDMQTDVLQLLPTGIDKTGVFVNESEAAINTLIDEYGFTAVQLHGDESPEFCATFKGKVKVLKAFGVDEAFDFERLNAYVGVVDYFLFDTKTEAHGGSGRVFNWAILDNYLLNVPFFISGGLSLDNIENVYQIKHQQFYGVDLNSRFETEPGIKHIGKLEEAFKILRQQIEQ